MTASQTVEAPPIARGAVQSVVWALVGLITSGVVLGVIAIVNAQTAQEAIAEDPRLGGATLAQMGYWFGVVAIIQHAIRLTLRVAAF